MDDIFISYSRRDQQTAERLQEVLDQEGWEVWWDQEIRVGRRWNKALTEALNRSKAIVILWSKNSVESEWVVREAQHAYDHNKLFSVILEQCDIPEPFQEIQWVELQDWTGGADHPSLVRLLRSLAERTPPSRIDTLRPGYDSSLLGEDQRVPWPNVTGTARQLHYLHFSVVMNPARRLAWYVAYNVDMEAHDQSIRRRDTWLPDPLVPEELQPGQKHFLHSGYDRGHLAPRYLLMWGDHRQAQIASHQAFFWTNTGPQHPKLNRGNYLTVEKWERTLAERCVRLVGFAGPVFRDDDPPFRDEEPGDDGFVAYGTFRMPRAYWKLIVAVDEDGNLAHRAFCFENPSPHNEVDFDPSVEAHTVELAELGDLTHLEFPSVLLEAALLDI